jgi:hypothetical protein
MEEIRCLVRSELVNGRKFVLLAFPDHSVLEGKINCWSPIDGHVASDKEYVMKETEEADDELATKMMSRYERLYEPAQGPFKLKRLKKFPR